MRVSVRVLVQRGGVPGGRGGGGRPARCQQRVRYEARRVVSRGNEEAAGGRFVGGGGRRGGGGRQRPRCPQCVSADLPLSPVQPLRLCRGVSARPSQRWGRPRRRLPLARCRQQPSAELLGTCTRVHAPCINSCARGHGRGGKHGERSPQRQALAPQGGKARKRAVASSRGCGRRLLWLWGPEYPSRRDATSRRSLAQP